MALNHISQTNFPKLLYSRLALFKSIAANIPSKPFRSFRPTLTTDLGLSTVAAEGPADVNHFYEVLLESCERLFDNEIEQHVFEDQMRHIFGTKVNQSCTISGLTLIKMHIACL
jgi:paired amphipathic helix protein Sin3a